MSPLGWTDLETRFRALQTSLGPTGGWFRLDYKSGSTGEHWFVTAFADSAAEAEFETLSTIAGGLLLTLPATAVAPEALAEPKAKYRWYLAIWHHLTPQLPDHKSFAGPNDKVGTVFDTLIRKPIELSATLCLQFSTIVPPVSRTQMVLAKVKGSTVGRVLWWFGEEPLRKLLGSLLVGGVLAAIPPIRHVFVALLKWILSLLS